MGEFYHRKGNKIILPIACRENQAHWAVTDATGLAINDSPSDKSLGFQVEDVNSYWLVIIWYCGAPSLSADSLNLIPSQ